MNIENKPLDEKMLPERCSTRVDGFEVLSWKARDAFDRLNNFNDGKTHFDYGNLACMKRSI